MLPGTCIIHVICPNYFPVPYECCLKLTHIPTLVQVKVYIPLVSHSLTTKQKKIKMKDSKVLLT